MGGKEEKILREAREALVEVRRRLLDMQTPEGFWPGRLSSSALATAVAVSALASLRREGYRDGGRDEDTEIISRGLEWLAGHQNRDGGYGDTPDSPSNLPTTMLATAAFHMAGAESKYQGVIRGAESYVTGTAGRTEDERARALTELYAPDRTFVAPILCNLAMAGLIRWDLVPELPFELAAVPRSLFRFLRLHVVSYALPALIAVGRLIHARKGTRNAVRGIIRDAAAGKAMKILEGIQPESGGFLEAVPLTAFVTMSLAGAGCGSHRVAERGAAFLRSSARPDGSWPVDINLSVWVTSAAVSTLSPSGRYDGPRGADVLKWLLERQSGRQHPYTGAAPGGWGWTHLPGSVPDADDTAGALLALAALASSASAEGASEGPSLRPRSLTGEKRDSDAPGAEGNTGRDDVLAAAARGVRWLLDLQNDDGGWPTFCRGWGKLPFDRSAPDLTAHAIRALARWADILGAGLQPAGIVGRGAILKAVARGREYLRRSQLPDGSWIPLWFGCQQAPEGKNPVFGTARVLAAYCDLNLTQAEEAAKGVKYLLASQGAEGGWGGCAGADAGMEETALVVDVLCRWRYDRAAWGACLGGVEFLSRRVREGGLFRPSPIGLYFARLWYSEEAYPVVWSAGALGRFAAFGETAR